MKQETLEWFYEHFMLSYSSKPDKEDPAYQECAEEAKAASDAFFATFTPEQDSLYMRFEAAQNALGALQYQQYFYAIFRFAWDLLR